MNIVIRTDASVHIGSGHVMRCLVLAQGLITQGHRVSFVCRPQTGDLVAVIENKGFCVYKLAPPTTALVPTTSADYVAWLQVPWQQDAANLFTLVAAADLVIVDHYALNANWQQRIQQALHCKIMVIDDLVRSHHADLILDQTLLRRSDEYQSQYQPSHDETKVLTGCEFALLNPQFSYYRQQVLTDHKLSIRPKLLLSMGGIDQPNATLQVLTALAAMPVLARPLVTVLLGLRAPHYQQVVSFCLQHNDWITQLDFVDNMAELMVQQQVAIGAPGTTAWERACLGLPSIIIPLAENQLTISRNLVAVDAAYKVELDDISEKLILTYQRLLQNWSALRQNNLKLCDGLGLNRVLQAIAGLDGSEHVDNSRHIDNTGCLQFRRADLTDIKLVYAWQCHPNTRQYALNKQVPSWSEHQRWMVNKLSQQQDYVYIITIPDTSFTFSASSDKQVRHGISVGVVRLDSMNTAEYLLSIFIDPAYYGQGIAKLALAYLDALHPHVTIHAKVLMANTASQRLFTQSRFQRLTVETFIRYPQA
ncbi:UDP-2,4-diacetamido-2,4,6-trideoxy-beta-L-altropyranose hydrolase [Moritella yayanosii]|uniref:Polysaccharide biosynthesis protein n=1 Tax=Moritella yayanosii TaxID=69539 RepID=A0A330LV13_9GAMM|nr:UDP-2,4-diacetamido-2,4,6-trideoxy-beta-L-altropyranose hydrolase [Moritella yayanosii]SQD80156.1 Polysaccharide biosynthesis protein [Moritella yayanosii]